MEPKLIQLRHSEFHFPLFIHGGMEGVTVQLSMCLRGFSQRSNINAKVQSTFTVYLASQSAGLLPGQI